MRGRYHSVQRAGAILCKDYGEVRGRVPPRAGGVHQTLNQNHMMSIKDSALIHYLPQPLTVGISGRNQTVGCKLAYR
jgi:hypothetical protein